MFIRVISGSPIIAGPHSAMSATNASIAGNPTRPCLSASALRWLWLLVPMLFLPRCVQADIYSEIPDNSWIHVGPGTQAGQAAGREPPFGIVAFSGMAIDDRRDQLLFFGGGHDDYWGNEVWSWNIATRAWLKAYEPDPLRNVDLAACLASVDNTRLPGMWMPSRRPISRHTYDSVEFISHMGVMMAGGASTYSGSGEYLWSDTSPSRHGCYLNAPGDLWFYDPATKSWQYKGSSRTDAGRDGITVAAYDGTTGNIVALGRDPNYSISTWIYDPLRNVFERKRPTRVAPWHGEIAATYDGKRRYVLFFGGEYPKSDQLWAYSVDQDTWVDLSPPTGVRPTAGGGYGIAYDSANDVVIVYGPSGLWIYDYARKSWTQPTTTLSPQTGRSVHGKLKYDVKRNVTFLAYGSSAYLVEVWAYRYKKSSHTKAIGGVATDPRPKSVIPAVPTATSRVPPAPP